MLARFRCLRVALLVAICAAELTTSGCGGVPLRSVGGDGSGGAGGVGVRVVDGGPAGSGGAGPCVLDTSLVDDCILE